MKAEIRNREQLLKTGDIESRRLVLDITEEVLNRLNAYGRIRSVMKREGSVVTIGNKSWDLSRKRHVYLIGAGKACNAMARAVEDVLGEWLTDGIAIVKIQEEQDQFKKVRVYTGGHPLPNGEGYAASLKVLELIEQADERDLFFCVMSGGSSALMSCPADGITLEEERLTTDLLLKSGAGIREINSVRRHISRMNGGRMAERIAEKGAELVGFNISDSVSNPPTGDITVPWEHFNATPMGPDQTTLQEALLTLYHYNLGGKLPESVMNYLNTCGEKGETPKAFPRNTYYQINTLPDSCVYALEAARRRGIPAIVLTTYLEGEAKDAGMLMASLAREIQEHRQPAVPPCLIFSAGEVVTTITDNSAIRGHGGPSQEMALGFALKSGTVPGACFLSVDSEGTDGTTIAAGAITDSSTGQTMEQMEIDLYQALREHSSFEALSPAGCSVITGNTGTNICDFNVLFVPEKGETR